MRRKRMMLMALVMMSLVAIFGIAWTVEYTLRIHDAVFMQDWSKWPFVDDGIEITSMMRAAALTMYIPIFLIAFFSIGTAMMTLNFFRQGRFFDTQAARYLILTGCSLIAIGIADTLMAMFELVFYTQWNAEGPVAPRYVYDAGDITIALAGIGFLLFGGIMREAVLLARENEAYV